MKHFQSRGDSRVEQRHYVVSHSINHRLLGNKDVNLQDTIKCKVRYRNARNKKINDGRFVSLNNLEIINAMLQFALLAKHNLFRHTNCAKFLQTCYPRNTGENIQRTCPKQFSNKNTNFASC